MRRVAMVTRYGFKKLQAKKERDGCSISLSQIFIAGANARPYQCAATLLKPNLLLGDSDISVSRGSADRKQAAISGNRGSISP
jgi:hypothetical protein